MEEVQCLVCGDRVAAHMIVDHLGEHDIQDVAQTFGAEVDLLRWPDGGLVVIPDDVSPEDFA